MLESTKLIALKIYPDRVVEKVELPPAQYKYQRMQIAIGDNCRTIDIKDTYTGLGLEEYCLVFDDEFLLQAKSTLNPIASYLYGYQKHDQPLCNNVLVMKNYMTADEELETIGLTEDDISKIKNFIDANMDEILEVANDFTDKIIIQRMLSMALHS